MRLFDTTVGTFLRPPFGRMATEILKRWSEEGTDSGIEEHDMLLAQQLDLKDSRVKCSEFDAWSL